MLIQAQARAWEMETKFVIAILSDDTGGNYISFCLSGFSIFINGHGSIVFFKHKYIPEGWYIQPLSVTHTLIWINGHDLHPTVKQWFCYVGPAGVSRQWKGREDVGFLKGQWVEEACQGVYWPRGSFTTTGWTATVNLSHSRLYPITLIINYF